MPFPAQLTKFVTRFNALVPTSEAILALEKDAVPGLTLRDAKSVREGRVFRRRPESSPFSNRSFLGSKDS